MPKVAVTGATGFVGTHLLHRLAHSAWTAVPLVRRPSGLAGEEVVGALESAGETTIAPLDAMIHLAARTHVMNETDADPLAAYRATNVAGTEAALRMAQRAGVKHFVFLSSVKAMGEETAPGHPFTETTAPAPEDPYGLTKLEAEQLVRSFCEANSMAWTIVRPPLVYGPGVKANFQALAKLARSGIPLPFGSTSNRRSLVYVGNLVDFLVFALDNESAQNALFLLDDGAPFSTGAMLRAMAEAEGRKARLVAFPANVMKFATSSIGKSGVYRRLFGSLELDSSAARAAGWSPPYSSAQGFAATLAKD